MNTIAPKWAEISAISAGLNKYRLPLTDDLVGRTFRLHFLADVTIVECSFQDKRRLIWKVTEGINKGQSTLESYEGICVDRGIYFISFANHEDPRDSVCIALDLPSFSATVVFGKLPRLHEMGGNLTTRMKQGLDLSLVHVAIRYAAIDPSNVDNLVVTHKPTTALIGKRVQYTYGDGGVYEHIYLNEMFFTWHCLAGPEQGLADTERCDCIQISSDIYLFTWREKIIPAMGVVMVNAQEMHSNGILLGVDTTNGLLTKCAIAAKGTVLSETRLPALRTAPTIG